MSRLFRVFVGSAPPDSAGGVFKTSEGVPIIGGMDSSNGSKMHFDRDGNYFLEASKNLFIKGKEVFEELDKRNIIIADSEAITALTISLNALEKLILSSSKIEVSGDELKMSIDGTAEIFSPNIHLGKANSMILESEAEDEQYSELSEEEYHRELSTHDPILIKKFFVKWWETFMVPVLTEFGELKSKYNQHTHSFTVPPPEEVNTVTTDAEIKAKNIGALLASKTVKAI
jgi:hypothetical protein